MSYQQSTLPQNFILPHTLSGLPKDTPILVGFSGGADSTALLHLLCRYGKLHGAEIFAAHVHHGIRGKEADCDEEFCKNIASQFGVKLFVHHADVPKLAQESGESIETAARRVRYDFFNQIMLSHNIPLLATGHNADDNLETMLFHLIRGSGLNGMCGIPVSRLCPAGSVIRPILGMTRAEILNYCKDRRLNFVTDSTNIDTDYTRNKIRSEIIPHLKNINPAATESAGRLAENLRADHLCLESMAQMFLEEMRNGYALETEKINGSPSAVINRAFMMLYREISHGASLEYTHIIALRNLSQRGVPHSAVTLPNAIEAVIEDGWLVFRTCLLPTPIASYSLPILEGNNPISQTNCEIVMRTSQNTKNIYKKSILLSIDSAKINGKLYMRNRIPGDRILMGGMHKSLKKLLCDKKIPLAIRPRLPVICDDNGILAVPMIGIRDQAAVPENMISSAINLHFYLYDSPNHVQNIE